MSMSRELDTSRTQNTPKYDYKPTAWTVRESNTYILPVEMPYYTDTGNMTTAESLRMGKQI